MDTPGLWRPEYSGAKGAAFSVIKALKKRADVCLARVKVEKIIADTRLSARTVFRALAELEELAEVQRLEGLKDRRVRVYHLKKICAIERGPSWQVICPQLADFLGTCKLDDRPKNRMAQIPLFGGPLPKWEPVITDEELRWRSEELKRRLGIPVKREEFRLRMPES